MVRVRFGSVIYKLHVCNFEIVQHILQVALDCQIMCSVDGNKLIRQPESIRLENQTAIFEKSNRI